MKSKIARLFRWLFAKPNPPFQPSGTKQRIAFITKGSFSYANTRILKALENSFPEYEVEHIDLAELLQENKLVCILNLFAIFWVYGSDILSRRRSIRDCFYRTPFLFFKVKKLMAARIKPGVHAFSLQTQSLLDTSTPNVPHFVYTDHTHLANLCYPAFDRTKLLPASWINLERQIYANAAKVFVMTHQIERILVEQYACAPSKVSCIYIGCNLSPRIATDPKNDYQNKRILFVGIDWKRKGGPQLIKAFDLVLEKIPEATLVIAGCRPKLENPNVQVLGRVPIEVVQEEYLKCSVFAFPTRIESCGFVVIEAMMHRIPVVGTPIGVMADTIRNGEDGCVVDPDDVKGLAEALVDLLEDPDKCRRFGEKGYQLASERYSWEAVGASLREEITKAISQPLS